jgi:glycine/D-amino acid oxidase-like deaminating enzyme
MQNATPAGQSRVLVIGAGVVGLTTALCACQAGYQVVVVAERFAPDITSVVAGALWEWPPAVCGHHRDESSLERSKAWCVDSYRRFWRLAADPGHRRLCPAGGLLLPPLGRRQPDRAPQDAGATGPGSRLPA